MGGAGENTTAPATSAGWPMRCGWFDDVLPERGVGQGVGSG
jgi:hypothetical protein